MSYKEKTDASTITSGILPYSRGGTGLTSLGTAGQVIAVKTDLSGYEFKSAIGTVTSVSGTTNRLSTSGTATDPILDISASYVGQSSITTLGTIATGVWHGTAVGLTYGGTGATTAQGGINALAAAVTTGYYLRGNGTNVVMSAIQAADVPTLNQNTSGTAGNVTGTVAIVNGGTGQTTQAAALDAIAGAVTSGYYLRGSGTHVVLAAIQAADVPTLNQNTTGSALWATSIPQNSQTSAYSLVAADKGKHVSITTGGVTVPQTVFAAGDVVSIYNNSVSNQTITQGTGVTLRLAGSATVGNRTLAQYGVCTVLCVATNVFVISGQGLT